MDLHRLVKLGVFISFVIGSLLFGVQLLSVL